MLQPTRKLHRVHSLTGRITMPLMYIAFKAVRRNRGVAGIDKQSIVMFESNLEANLMALMRELKTGSYEAIALMRVYVPKGNGKQRPLGIPAVRCRVAQEVVRSLINPIFDPIFHDYSHGFRAGRSCHTAINQFVEYREQGYRFVLDADIKGFFDNIPHELIMGLVTREIADGNILRLIRKFLQAGVMENDKILPTRKGTPQGGVISPLLANIVLDHLDWQLEKHGYKFVRYADDFIVLCKTRGQAEKALSVVTHCIEKELGLELSPEKTHISHMKKGFNFLGFRITTLGIRMGDKAVESFKDKVRTVTVRSRNLDAEAIVKLNQIIRGTVNYFGATFATTFNQFKLLDCWIRKRFRCMKYKRIWMTDNYRLKIKHIERAGLLSCLTALDACKTRALIRTPLLHPGQSCGGRPVRERCTLGNMGN